ncbi:helix-turn-helix domain-containing protein [Streptomyces chrestomyceticus]|uniref:helix-turn-helix domain-containing protein n=1 Tax=Streptomyces chrestomyceticus TaxID=68185 RepID=UPI00340B92F9
MTRLESNALVRSVAAIRPFSGVIHVRHHHTVAFTVLGNHLALNPRISAIALGYAVRIQALPDGATVSIRELAKRYPETEYKIGEALKELEAEGYLVRERVRIDGQRIVTRTTYYENPADRLRSTAPTPPQRRQAPPPPPPPAPPPPPQPVDAHEPPQTDTAPTPGVPPTDTAAAPGAPEAPETTEASETPAAIVVSPPPQVAPPPRAPAEPPALVPSPAADLLCGLRLADARLTLSVRDVNRLVPAVSAWLDRGVPAAHVARTLVSDLPDGVIFRAASLLEHRLTEWLPPPLPVRPAEEPRRVRGAVQECQLCGLPFAPPPESTAKASAPAPSTSLVRCPRCRTADTWTAAAPRPPALRNVQAPTRLRTGAAASGRTPAARARSGAARALPR